MYSRSILTQNFKLDLSGKDESDGDESDSDSESKIHGRKNLSARSKELTKLLKAKSQFRLEPDMLKVILDRLGRTIPFKVSQCFAFW